MVDTQTMIQVIIQAAIETMQSSVQAMAVARVEERTRHGDKSVSMGSKSGRSTLKKSVCDWSTTEKYPDLRNFRLGVNIFKIYNTNSINGVSIIKKTGLVGRAHNSCKLS